MKASKFLSPLLGLLLAGTAPQGHASGYQPPRTAAGKPDLNGVWQVMNNANYNVEPDNARAALQMRAGPVVPVPAKELVALGAVGAVPASLGVIVDQGEEKKIPYQVWALKQRDDNREGDFSNFGGGNRGMGGGGGGGEFGWQCCFRFSNIVNV